MAWPPSKDANGWSILSGPTIGRYIYVSNAGDDGNDGLTPGTAVATINQALSMRTNNQDDYILFRRGDTWVVSSSAAFSIAGWRGLNEDNPLVIGAYGSEATARPQFRLIDQSAISVSRNIAANTVIRHVVFVDLDFYGASMNPAEVEYDISHDIDIIDFNHDYENFMVEGCSLHWGTQCAVFQNRNENLIATGLVLRRNVLAYNHSFTSGHFSQGFFAYGLVDLVIEENIFFRNGWAVDRDLGRSDGQGGGIADDNNHAMYLDNSNPTNVATDDKRGTWFVRDNLVAESSSHGIQYRCGGSLTGNIFTDCALSIQMGEGSDHEVHSPDGVDGIVQSNIVLNTVDIESTTDRGLAIESANIRNCLYNNNIVSMSHSSIINNFGLRVDDGDATNGSRGVIVTDNIFYDFYRGFLMWSQGTPVIDLEEDNYYWEPEGSNEWVDSGRSGSFPGTGNFESADQPWPDPTRDVDRYNAEVLGGSNDHEAFFTAAITTQRKGTWSTAYEAATVSNWIREGFGLSSVVDEIGMVNWSYKVF